MRTYVRTGERGAGSSVLKMTYVSQFGSKRDVQTKVRRQRSI